MNHLAGFEAPLVGLMPNRFQKGADIDNLDGQTEENVVLEPIIDDVLGERSREGLSEFAKALDAFAREAAGFLEPRTTAARLPVRAMFLKGLPYVGADNEILGTDMDMQHISSAAAESVAQWA